MLKKALYLVSIKAIGGNQGKAVAALGIDRRKLYRRLKQYNEFTLEQTDEATKIIPTRRFRGRDKSGCRQDLSLP